MKYTKQQAIEILDTYLSTMQLTRPQHTQVVECLKVLEQNSKLEPLINNGIKSKENDKGRVKT